MKRLTCILFSFLLLVIQTNLYSQDRWKWDGNDIYNDNTGRVKIGASNDDGQIYFHNLKSDNGILYGANENGSAVSRFCLRFDITEDASYPYLTNRTEYGKVVIKTGIANGGGENTHFTIEGGDNTVKSYFEDVHLGIGTTNPGYPLEIFESTSDNGSTLLLDAYTNTNPNIMFQNNGTTSANLRVYDSGNDQFQIQVGSSLDVAMSISTTGLVGIGIDDPSQELHVSGDIRFSGNLEFNGTDNMIYKSGTDLSFTADDDIIFRPDDDVFFRTGDNPTGDWVHFNNDAQKVGIGTTFPGDKLEVIGSSGSVRIKVGHSDEYIRIGHDGANTLITNVGTDALLINYSQDNKTVSINKNTSSPGPVEIGGNLYVDSCIWAEEISVDLNNPYADFVFEEDYNLMPLDDLDQFIKENKHLPDIPVEEEVMENGMDLGKMNILLLQKVEELTLYIIEQDKTIRELKEDIKAISE